MPRKAAKPEYADWTARLKAEVPPVVPSPGRQLDPTQSRMLGLWARRWISRPPAVKVNRRGTALIRSWIRGTRLAQVGEWTKLYEYCLAQKAAARQKRQAVLQIRVGGGMLSLSRPFEEPPAPSLRLLQPRRSR